MTEDSRELLLKRLANMSSKALRCLGFAYKEQLGEFESYTGEDHPAHRLLLDPSNYSNIESDLVFVGMAGIRVSFSFAFGRSSS